MTTINAQIPDMVYRQMKAISEREQIPFDQLIAMALAAQASVWIATGELEQRARRAKPGRLKGLLSKAGNEPPQIGDELH